MSTGSKRAIIIGAGIGGLAAGIALKRIGVDVAVFEQAGELKDVGAGLSLWTNGIRALDRLGLGETLRSFSTPFAVAGLRIPDGTVLTAGSAAELERRLGVVCVVLHRADLLTALFAELGSEHVHTGACCTRVRADTDTVAAEFADGRCEQGHLIVGADGLHSGVRATLHGPRPPAYAGYTAWRAIVGFDTALVQASETWGRGARFGQVPMSHQRVYWFAVQNAEEGGHHTSEKAALLDLFGAWHAPIRALIEATDETAILRNDIYDRPPLRWWGRGRMTLLGDAAHPMTPNLGQGAGQALEDAVVLARCLEQERSTEVALRAYERLRIPRTRAITLQSRRVGAVAQWQHPLAVALRDTLIRHISPLVEAGKVERVVAWDV